jgi:biopolymer transport protein ExbD
MDDGWEFRSRRRTQIDIPIAPVLDMLVAVIFFLLVSTTFVGYTKQSDSPSRVSTTDQFTAQPSGPAIAPRLLVTRDGDRVILNLRWRGSSAGQTARVDARGVGYSKELLRVSGQLIDNFARRFPDEKTLRLGFNRSARYQDVITAMDGVLRTIPNVVLLSYTTSATDIGMNP